MKTHYLFSLGAVNIYINEGFNALIEEIKNNTVAYSTFEFEEGVTPSEHIVEAFDGWDGYVIITKQQYTAINAIELN